MEKMEFNPMTYYRLMRTDGVILSYNGTISQNILTNLGLSLRNKIYTNNVIGKLIFSTFVELAQNVLLHSDDRSYSLLEERELGNGVILVKETREHYIIISGNVAKHDVADKVVERCRHINSLDEEALKNYFKEMRKKPHEEDKDGGNIGLIELARKSGNPIDVKSDKIDDEHAFLTMYVTLNKYQN